MIRRFAVLLALTATVCTVAPAGASSAPSGIVAPSPAAALRPAVRVRPPAPPAQAPTYEVVTLVNAERAKFGLPALRIDDRLMLAAQRHSADQAARNTMSHVGSDGSNAGQRITAAGFAWSSWAENVAYGYGSAAGVVAGWMGSEGHRQNNLSSNTHVGVGLAYSASGVPYWTMVFASPR